MLPALIPIAGAGITAGIQAAGVQAANDMNWDQFVSNQVFQANAITSARQFEADMSNTAVWRRKMDLERSGINPMLAAGDVGASTPSAPIGNPGVGNAAQNTMASAGQAVMLAKDLALADKEMLLRDAQALESANRAEREIWEARLAEERIAATALETKQRGYQTPAVRAETRSRVNEAQLDLEHRARERVLNQIHTGVSSAAEAARAIRGRKGGFSQRDIDRATKRGLDWGRAEVYE